MRNLKFIERYLGSSRSVTSYTIFDIQSWEKASKIDSRFNKQVLYISSWRLCEIFPLQISKDRVDDINEGRIKKVARKR